MSKPVLNVSAGMLIRADGHILVAQRPEGKSWAGWWELPGGKIEPGETSNQALERELKEELGINIQKYYPWVTLKYEYPKTIAHLNFFRVTRWINEPTGIEGQQLAWIAPGQNHTIGPLLPATIPPLEWIQIPDKYLITDIRKYENLDTYIAQLKNALLSGVRMVQFREPELIINEPDQTKVYKTFQSVNSICNRLGAICIINSCHSLNWWKEASGVQLKAEHAHNQDYINQINKIKRSGKFLVGASVHNLAQIHRAQEIEANFAVIGHVLPTPSHPGTAPIGWHGFRQIAIDAGLPVFAIGGQSIQTYNTAMQNGAHGIAAIRGLLHDAPTLRGF